MLIVDSHQHFWEYNIHRHAWIDDSMQVLKRDFLPQDLLTELQKNHVDGCIAVQADQSIEETHFLLSLAKNNNFIRGVVGWIDLRDVQLADKLEQLRDYSLLKGFRHILQSESPDFMLQDSFLNGIALLEKYGYTYDILIYPNHFNAALKLVQTFPSMRFVVDHLAKPDIKGKQMDQWKQGIENLSQCSNVYCKISGMATEADWNTWTVDEFMPYLDNVVSLFGMKRLMFGSDWPVCMLATSYEKWLDLLKAYFSAYSPQEQAAFFGLNAVEFYHL